jgi:uncharacterized protein YjbI with pentapeptide repeats
MDLRNVLQGKLYSEFMQLLIRKNPDMSRDALIVGINTYSHLSHLKAPATDAEAIAKRLQQDGEFRVWRSPEIFQDQIATVGKKTQVTTRELRLALEQLFKPKGQQIPETALFYFSGHGIRDDSVIPDSYLATSEVSPGDDRWGLSLRWLRRLLEESPIRQQVIWLDCCHSGELLNFNEANPGERGNGRDRCFIAASRDSQVAYESLNSSHSVLTQALLEGLNPNRQPDRWIDNLLLTDFVNQALKRELQSPIYSNFGEPIGLTRQWQESAVRAVQESAVVCPYKGLRYFDWNSEDPKYFHGRTVLTDQLLDQVRQHNFLAITGASGSGKSSVLRAGLLHQLKQGRRIGGSDRWQIRVLIPGEHPMQALALAFVLEDLSHLDRAEQLRKAEDLLSVGANGLRRLVETAVTERFILVVDQFEEVFTVCANEEERQKFFECLLKGLQLSPKLCVILAMRADFFGKCVEQEYCGLARQIEQHLITVTPMSRMELKEAIVKPAERVNLSIESQLVEQMIVDVIEAPGSLPLLQYTLTELWKQRNEAGLQLTQYSQLGGISGALQKRATAVYEGFPEEERATVQHIFLALTQLGDGTEDTRRRVLLANLVSIQHPEAVLNPIVQKLADEKLIVTSEIVAKDFMPQRVAVVDVAHEALIRHWELLRLWLEERRDQIRQVRKLEIAASEWSKRGQKIEDLMQGRALISAKQLQRDQAKREAFNPQVESFIQQSIKQQRLNRLKVFSSLVIPAIIIASIVESALRLEGVKQDYKRLDSSSQIEERVAAESLVAGCDAVLTASWLPLFVAEKMFGNCRSLSQAPLEKSNLSRANMSNANLIGANLGSANLTEANLASANLTGANLGKANLNSVNLSKANLAGNLSLTKINFSSANLSSANFGKANLAGSNLSRADMSNADFSNANLAEVDLTEAKVKNVNFSGANLNQSVLISADLYKSDLSKANFSAANLSSANLSSVNLTGTTFNEANLSSAILAGAVLRDSNFSKANLRSSNFVSADLGTTSFKGADLSGARFYSTDFRRVDLRNAILVSINFLTTKRPTQLQLEGQDPPLLCNITLPSEIPVDPNRDCDRLPQIFLERYPREFKTIRDAEVYLDALRKRK